jgi:hypothetical protein
MSAPVCRSTSAIGMKATDRQFLGEFDLARSYWPELLQLHRGGRSCH